MSHITVIDLDLGVNEPSLYSLFKSSQGLTLALSQTDTALKYSNDPQALKKLLEAVTISARLEGKRKYFPEDKEERAFLIVTVTRGERSINFSFGCSLNDTEALFPVDKEWPPKLYILKAKRQKFLEGLLYSLLCCIGSEYYCSKSFSEFCSDFGDSTDSIKAKATWEACLEQSAKLERIFTAEEINCLPS